MGSRVTQNGSKCVSAISSSCNRTKSCYILAFFHSCKWPHWVQVLFGASLFFNISSKERTLLARWWKKSTVFHILSTADWVTSCPSMALCSSWSSLCVPTSPFYLARQGNFFEIRPLSLQWVTQSHSRLSFPSYIIDFKFNFKVHESFPCPPCVVLPLFLCPARQLLWNPSLHFSMHLT